MSSANQPFANALFSCVLFAFGAAELLVLGRLFETNLIQTGRGLSLGGGSDNVLLAFSIDGR
jgi:hypothetical protein